MRFGRREILRLFIGGGLLASSGLLFRSALFPPLLSKQECSAFSAFIDTLIPTDSTPGAVQLGVPGKIFVRAEKDTNFRLLLRDGCRWLEKKAKEQKGVSFTALNEAARQEVVEILSHEPEASLARTFFEIVRSDSFFHYYGNPLSWNGQGNLHPPQPNGFPDYTRPPAL